MHWAQRKYSVGFNCQCRKLKSSLLLNVKIFLFALLLLTNPFFFLNDYSQWCSHLMYWGLFVNLQWASWGQVQSTKTSKWTSWLGHYTCKTFILPATSLVENLLLKLNFLWTIFKVKCNCKLVFLCLVIARKERKR